MSVIYPCQYCMGSGKNPHGTQDCEWCDGFIVTFDDDDSEDDDETGDDA